MRTIAIVVALLLGCGSKGEKVTREQCSQVADHIADVIIDHFIAHPDELWDATAAANVGSAMDTGVPASVTKQTFKAFLDSPEGKTWLMQRRGQVRSGTENGIEPCVKSATQRQVSCLLAAKSRDDVTACDKAK